MFTYRVKVKTRSLQPHTFLWGGEQIVRPFSKGLYLIIRVDETGEDIILNARDGNGGLHSLGTLKAGELYSVSLNDFTGVAAESNFDTYVNCAILPSNG